MTKHQLQLRSAHELASERFFVPAYQRGFRWKRQQVEELLDDVWEFVHSGARARGQFYCLQPVVVSLRSSGEWEVVDGQQRLTTLYLILHRFNRRLQAEDQIPLYGIEYETRPASSGFLRELDAQRARENIDFFHMTEAYAAISDWMQSRKSRINDMESAFLNDVKVIWYEIGDTNPIEVFQRLNIGKISLTDAELVKAMLLRASNFRQDGDRALQLQQLQIAHEWDAIERRLGENDFWFFLTNTGQESNRIEFILELYAATIPADDPVWSDRSVFHVFSRHLASRPHAWTLWEEVKALFQTVEEWYRDPTLYHLVGYLTAIDASGIPHRAIAQINALAAAASSKRAFRDALRTSIFRRLFGNRNRDQFPARGPELRAFLSNELADLGYDNNRTRIREFLLLFNVSSLMTSESHSRFPFEAYNVGDWDLEHIRSVQSRRPERPHEQKDWLERLVEFLGDEKVQAAIDETDITEDSRRLARDAQRLLTAPLHDDEGFRAFFDEVQKLYHPEALDLDVDNSLGNLTLLDASTNRGYGNAIFPIKRKTIIQRDRVGGFVPLCTRNVFLKYYSSRVDRMLDWTREDASKYFNAIVDTLTDFFSRETPA